MGRLQDHDESGDINEMNERPRVRCSTAFNVPEESDATRAINAATSVLLAFFCFAAQDITERLLGPRPALAEAYARHRSKRRARWRTPPPRCLALRPRARTTMRPRLCRDAGRRHSLSSLAPCCGWTDCPSASELLRSSRVVRAGENSPLA